MAMKVIVKDEYLNQFEQVLKKLTEDAVVVRKSLDEENKKRSQSIEVERWRLHHLVHA